MLFARHNELRPTTSGRYFFVVGYPRSGTTLASVLLDRHSRLCVPPETAFFDEVAPLLTSSKDSVLMKVLGEWRRLPELHLEPEMVRRRMGKKSWNAGDVLAAILDLYALGKAKARCGEKTPQHLIHVPTIRRLFPQAKIVCVMRDGRDAVLSLHNMPWGVGLKAAAELWQRYVRLMEEFISHHESHFMVMRYEELLHRPEQVLFRVMEFLGESFEAGQLNWNIPSQVVLPRSMQWKGKALEPIDVQHANHRRLSAQSQDLEFLERFLAGDLRRHGYVI